MGFLTGEGRANEQAPVVLSGGHNEVDRIDQDVLVVRKFGGFWWVALQALDNAI